MVNKFINPNLVIAQTSLMQGQSVADLGCGSGFFVVPAAQMVGPKGTVYAVDVMQDKLAATASITGQFGLKNVRVVQADLNRPFLGLAENSCDMVIAGNILHEINPKDQLMKNIYRLLKTGGQVLVVEWKKTATPFGPPLDKRIDQQQLEILLMGKGLRKVKELETDGYHYAVVFEK